MSGDGGVAAPAPLAPASHPGLRALQARGVLLFLPIPVVLFLFVRHPRPLAASLAVGIALMLGHRFVARPYMEVARRRKCLWCNGAPLAPVTLPLRTGGGTLEATVCARHETSARRFFAFLARAAVVLRVGIFVPLLALLVALVAGAAGNERWLPAAVPVFQLVVGVMVNVAAIGYLGSRVDRGASEPLPVPFPAHNFFLLGVRALLWILRLVGLSWIVRGTLGLLALR